jgi:hypothetical protein
VKLTKLVEKACNKENFNSLNDYISFAIIYLEFVKDNLQAVIVSKNENNYRFFQYKKDGTYNITRPINSNLMYGLEEFEKESKVFLSIIKNIKGKGVDSFKNRKILNSIIYSAQQSIGAALDALPANKSNVARKINGDLFERFMKLLIAEIGVNVKSETVSIPVEINGETAFNMKYQHDLIIQVDSDIKAIGSVKTSSKDRIDKIFIDKFLYNKLTSSETPHFAIFLNDVQRKGKEGKFGINSTFLPGHFKGYTIKLNPLDGVYYCDIRPNMITEDILKDHIKTIDHFLFSDIWDFVQ